MYATDYYNTNTHFLTEERRAADKGSAQQRISVSRVASIMWSINSHSDCLSW